MLNLSTVTIAKNEEKHIEEFFKSVSWADEIILVDNCSSDRTVEIAKRYNAKIYNSEKSSYGLLKQYALKQASGDWILLLDVDELVSNELKDEIIKTLKSQTQYDAFAIPYENYFLGHVVKSQKYSKVRLFKRGYGNVDTVDVHEETIIRGKIGKLQGKILHYSFRTIPQTLAKFTRYAKIEAGIKYKKGENVSLKKLTLYPLHMLWSMFVEDRGYRDGIWGFGLAFCFAYMEFMRYFFLLQKERS